MKKILIIAMLIILSVVSYSKNKSYDEVPIEKIKRFTSSQLLTPTKADLIDLDSRGYALVKLLEGKYKNQEGYVKLKGIGEFGGIMVIRQYLFGKDPTSAKVYLHASHRENETEMGIVVYEDIPEIKGIIEHSDDVNLALYYRGYTYTINRFIAELAGDIDGESYDCSTESSRAYVELLSEGEYCK